MSEAHEKSDGQVPTPEPGVDELKHQLEIANQQLETERLRAKHFETLLEAQREHLRKEATSRQSLETLLQDRNTQHEAAEGKLKEKTSELETLKARKFNPNDLAKMGIGLFVLLVIGAGVLSCFILKATVTWWQTYAVLGLYLFCSAFAAVSMRLLADRCK
jgi:hypothetical protein